MGESSRLELALGGAALRNLRALAVLPEREDTGFPRTVGHYRLLRVAGMGGMGIVYEAEDTRLRQRVALKVLQEEDASAKELQRFHREAGVIARLKHPNIVSVFEVGEADGYHYISMEFVVGKTLQERLDQPMDLGEGVRLLRKVAEAVGLAHERGIVHRDLKPGNVMIGPEGEPVVMDFGLAKMEKEFSRLTRTGAAMGTPSFMSPEQVRGEGERIDARTDVWALGVMLYRVLAGSLPFGGDTAFDLFEQITGQDPAKPSTVAQGVPRGLDAVCLKALAKEPERRYSNGAEFADDLRRWMEGEPVHAQPASWVTRLYLRARRNPVPTAIGAAGLAGILIVAGTLVPLWRIERGRARAEREQTLFEMRKTAEISLDVALRLRRAGDVKGMRELLPRVEEACHRASDRAPDLAEPHYLLGRMYRALLMDDRALEEQEKAVALDSGIPSARYERAVLRLRRRESLLQDRRGAAEEAASLRNGPVTQPDPGSLEDQVTLALKDRAEEDLRVLEQGQEATGGMGLCVRGMLSLSLGKLDVAEKQLKEVVALVPNCEEAYESLALVARQRSQTKEAEDWYAAGLEHDKGYLPFLSGRGYLREVDGRDAAKRNADPSEAYADADRDLSAAVSIDPNRGSDWGLLGSVRLRWGERLFNSGADPSKQFSTAVAAYRRALALDSESPRSWTGLGASLRWSAKVEEKSGTDPSASCEEAITDFTRAISLGEKGGLAWNGRAIARVLLAHWKRSHGDRSEGSFQEAIADAKRAAELSPSDYDYRLTLANALIADAGSMVDLDECERRMEDARQAQGAAVTIDSSRPNAYESRARTWVITGADLETQGKDPSQAYRNALSDFQAALERGGGAGDTQTMLAKIAVQLCQWESDHGKEYLADTGRALQDLDAVIPLARHDPELLAKRGWARMVLARGKSGPEAEPLVDGAISDLTEVLKSHPKAADCLAFRGELLVRKGKYEAALDDLQKATALDPKLQPTLKALVEECEKHLPSHTR